MTTAIVDASARAGHDHSIHGYKKQLKPEPGAGTGGRAADHPEYLPDADDAGAEGVLCVRGARPPHPLAGRNAKISEFFGIAIYMCFDDHAPPHFHARYAEFEALIVGRRPCRPFPRFHHWSSGVLDRIVAAEPLEGELSLVHLVGRGVFAAWEDEAEFRKVFIGEESGTITWPGGLDLAPDALHQRLAESQSPTSSSRK